MAKFHRTNLVICSYSREEKPVSSSPELAQGELLGYGDVRRTCGRP